MASRRGTDLCVLPALRYTITLFEKDLPPRFRLDEVEKALTRWAKGASLPALDAVREKFGIPVDHWVHHPRGSLATVGRVAREWGADVEFMGVVGDDYAGHAIVERMKSRVSS